MAGMTLFEWDEAKAESNLRKHGISFDDAIEVFYDPYAVIEQDRVMDGELRWQLIGTIRGVVLLYVAHTMEERDQMEVIRIISARLADRRERRRYGQNC
jgi:uncharacterized DUF497 family protein